MREVFPTPLSRTFSKTGNKWICQYVNRQSARGISLTFAVASSHAPPRPCSLRKLFRIILLYNENNKKTKEGDLSLCILSGKIGRRKTSAENLFSLPICVIMGWAESLALWERWRRSRRRGQMVAMTPPLTRLRRELSQRESLRMRATIWVWALPDAFVIQMRNWR